MATQTEKTNTEVVHLSQERLHELSAAYGDTDKVLCARALAVWEAIGDGVEVKTMAQDLADAARVNPDINAVSERYLGLARFASTAADIIGVDLRAWIRRSPKDVAFTIRTAKRVGIGTARKAMTDAVKPIDAEKKSDREEAALTALGVKRAEVQAASVPAPRDKKQADADEAEGSGAVKPDKMTGPEALAALRAVTAYLTAGGAYTADLGSAGAEFAAAMASARKRGNTAAAKTAGRTVETAAA